jgi:hypothetical protein
LTAAITPACIAAYYYCQLIDTPPFSLLDDIFSCHASQPVSIAAY